MGKGQPRPQCKAASQLLLCNTPAPLAPPNTHSQPPRLPSVWGLTKRLFSKTLSLESESKSLQEAKGGRSTEEVSGAGVWSLGGKELTSSRLRGPQQAWGRVCGRPTRKLRQPAGSARCREEHERRAP